MMENLQNIEEECRKEVFVESYLKPLLIGLHTDTRNILMSTATALRLL